MYTGLNFSFTIIVLSKEKWSHYGVLHQHCLSHTTWSFRKLKNQCFLWYHMLFCLMNLLSCTFQGCMLGNARPELRKDLPCERACSALVLLLKAELPEQRCRAAEALSLLHGCWRSPGCLSSRCYGLLPLKANASVPEGLFPHVMLLVFASSPLKPRS